MRAIKADASNDYNNSKVSALNYQNVLFGEVRSIPPFPASSHKDVFSKEVSFNPVN
jgi:hypothetical protein